MRNIIAVASVAVVALLLIPSNASAQYKNFSIALDVGPWAVSAPPVALESNGQLSPQFKQPVRLRKGFRLGLENSFKLNDDHWWLSGRVNVGFLQFDPRSTDTPFEQVSDTAAHATLGTLVGLEVGTNLRYYFLTDSVRPFLQGGISFLRLLSFGGDSSGTVTCGTQDPALQTICGGQDLSADFLPHPNLGVVRLTPGLEVFVARDVAIHGLIDLQRWLVLNAADNNALVVAFGLTFYG